MGNDPQAKNNYQDNRTYNESNTPTNGFLDICITKLNSFEKFSNSINWIGVACLPIMFLIVSVDVVLRYFFSSPILGATEVQKFLFLLICFSGFSYCWNQDGHINMDLFTRRWNARGQALSKALSSLLGFILFGMVVWGEILQISITKMSMISTSELKIPEWPFHIVAAVIGGIFILQLFISMISSIFIAVRGEGG